MKIELPPRYYLAHFLEFLAGLEASSSSLFRSQDLAWLGRFRSLPEEAQCLLVRILHRQGPAYFLSEFTYPEIADIPKAAQDLFEAGLTRREKEHHEMDLVWQLGKEDLFAWANAMNLPVKKSARKQDLVLAVAEGLEETPAPFPRAAECFYLERETLDYFLFLYFGKIDKSLSLFTLRDLGIHQGGRREQNFARRFDTSKEAQTAFFYHRQKNRLGEILEHPRDKNLQREYSLEALHRWPPVDNEDQQRLVDEMKLRLARHFEASDLKLALDYLEDCQTHPARERRVRMLMQQATTHPESREAALTLLGTILQQPDSDEEAIFAQDFLRRKFQQERKSELTKMLDAAPSIELNEAFLGHAEDGVIDFLRRQNTAQVFHTENQLFNALFALWLWPLLFEGDAARIVNPFERRPQDILSRQFWNTHQQEIDTALAQITTSKQAVAHILQQIARHWGKHNDFFIWSPDLAQILTLFLSHAPLSAVQKILREMAENYQQCHKGFPDLMAIRPEEDPAVEFIEVKAEGDQLRPHQLGQMQRLKTAGFKVGLMKVNWTLQATCPYVVVDVETTGGRPPEHRITELAAVKIFNGEIVDEFHTLLQPDRAVPRFITQLTGISDDMLKDAPRFSEIEEKFSAFCQGAVFVAHNVAFDYAFIRAEYERLGQKWKMPRYCTCQGMRKTFPGLSKYGLKHLAETFDIELVEHHRATADARAAAQLLLMIHAKRLPPRS